MMRASEKCSSATFNRLIIAIEWRKSSFSTT